MIPLSLPLPDSVAGFDFESEPVLPSCLGVIFDSAEAFFSCLEVVDGEADCLELFSCFVFEACSNSSGDTHPATKRRPARQIIRFNVRFISIAQEFCSCVFGWHLNLNGPLSMPSESVS